MNTFQAGHTVGGEFYDTLGSEVPKIAICQLRPHLLMDWADFWYGGSFLVELPLKVAIFEEFKNEFIFPLGYPQTPTRASPGELWGEGGMIPIHNKR